MLKNGQEVEIICGKDKGKKGQIIEILRSKSRVKIKGIKYSEATGNIPIENLKKP